MEKAIIGKKVGMTQIFDDAGKVIPVTVIEAGPCTVVQKKTAEKDGYNAVQLGYEDVAALPKGHTLARLLRMKPEEPARRREAPLPAEELPLEKAASSGAASEERKAPPARKAPSRGRGKYVPRHMR